jgi:hypothetical protein
MGSDKKQERESKVQRKKEEKGIDQMAVRRRKKREKR